MVTRTADDALDDFIRVVKTSKRRKRRVRLALKLGAVALLWLGLLIVAAWVSGGDHSPYNGPRPATPTPADGGYFAGVGE